MQSAYAILHRYKKDGYLLRHPAEEKPKKPSKMEEVAEILREKNYEWRRKGRRFRLRWLYNNKNFKAAPATLQKWYVDNGFKYGV